MAARISQEAFLGDDCAETQMSRPKAETFILLAIRYSLLDMYAGGIWPARKDNGHHDPQTSQKRWHCVKSLQGYAPSGLCLQKACAVRQQSPLDVRALLFCRSLLYAL